MSTLIKHLSTLLFLFMFLKFIFVPKNSSLVYGSRLASKHQDSDLYLQDNVTSKKDTTYSKRKLIGPGSSPPRCTWKCGRCTPCKPVHVPVPPGNPVTAEYYPEAWRCKCGNRLYMP
ncbi:EPIDERMAL PATTERNING FACTOR-like protein 4 [Rutidosis leptorrhynchoides]|uniref:EPIDERMAL PATTERNING FACTOR-like protein 4 n=1 Tax=Rutidosis leptorrhynchoides TaxID=125765 RepID=UPI003A99A067